MTKKSDVLDVMQFLFNWKTDWKPKAAIALALAYILFPVELIPDAVPVLGQLDDLGVGTLALWWLSYATKRYNIRQLEGGIKPSRKLP